jgi:hypothetical protein
MASGANLLENLETALKLRSVILTANTCKRPIETLNMLGDVLPGGKHRGGCN